MKLAGDTADFLIHAAEVKCLGIRHELHLNAMLCGGFVRAFNVYIGFNGAKIRSLEKQGHYYVVILT